MKPRKILRIARWEVTRSAGGIDRRTVAVIITTLALVGIVAPLIAFSGAGLDDDLYQVAVDEDNRYYEVFAADDTFRIVGSPEEFEYRDFEEGRVDLVVGTFDVRHANSPKGEAAYDHFRSSVERYTHLQLLEEENQSAAFPVQVFLEFHRQTGVSIAPGVDTDGAIDDPEDEDRPDDRQIDDQPDEPSPDPSDGHDEDLADDEVDLGEDEPVADDSEDTDGPTVDPDDDVAVDPDGDRADRRDDDGGHLGGFGAPLADDVLQGSPAEISPPFPFQSLVLAFLFVIPLNFLIQAYGSTILSERIKRRGELMLVAPVSRFDIIAGKTLPYFVAAVLIEGVLAFGLVYLASGRFGGLISILALVPLILLFLGATFLAAMFARSFKELTFLTVTITVTLTTYAFVPAIFTDIDQIALISPLTLVVRDLQQETITIAEFAFSTTPPTLAALMFFALGSGLYREEDMFDQRSIGGRVIDAMAGPITKRWHVGAMTAGLVPFVFLIQLIAISMLFALGEVSIILMLVVVAVVEELAKSLHIYAAYQHRRFEAGMRTALLLGAISGLAFFLAEKLALIAQLVGLPDLAIGEAGLMGGIITGPVILLFLLAPLALHVVTAAISAVGASHNKELYVLAVITAMIIHFCYNLGVVMLFVA